MKLYKIIVGSMLVLGSAQVWGMGDDLTDSESEDSESEDDTEYWDAKDNDDIKTNPGEVPGATPGTPGTPAPQPPVVPAPGAGNPPADAHEFSYNPYRIGAYVAGLGGVALGIKYLVSHSKMKQLADLHKLEKQSASLLKMAVKRSGSLTCPAMASIDCPSLDQNLQDKLDNAVTLYATAIQELYCAAKANSQVRPTALPEYMAAQAKLTVCTQVIAQCADSLEKQQTWANRLYQVGISGYTRVASSLAKGYKYLASKVKIAQNTSVIKK